MTQMGQLLQAQHNATKVALCCVTHGLKCLGERIFMVFLVAVKKRSGVHSSFSTTSGATIP